MTTTTTNHIDTVHAIYAAFATGDVPTIMGFLDDDIAWDQGVRETGLAWLKPGRGKAHVLGFFHALVGGMAFTTFEPVTIAGNGDYVVGVVREAGTILATGKAVEEDLFVHLWRFGADGKIIEVRHIGDFARQELASR